MGHVDVGPMRMFYDEQGQPVLGRDLAPLPPLESRRRDTTDQRAYNPLSLQDIGRGEGFGRVLCQGELGGLGLRLGFGRRGFGIVACRGIPRARLRLHGLLLRHRLFRPLFRLRLIGRHVGDRQADLLARLLDDGRVVGDLEPK